MNEREKTDELLRQMGEVHRRHEASHDENALLMRALERQGDSGIHGERSEGAHAALR